MTPPVRLDVIIYIQKKILMYISERRKVELVCVCYVHGMLSRSFSS